MTEIQTITHGTVIFDLHYDKSYLPDCVVKQLPKDDLEPELTDFLMRACRPGDTVVDAGANIGYFTLLMSKLVGSSGLVHAFEPHPDTAARLDRNVALNKAGNVLVHETALWDCLRDLSLYTCFEPGLASLRSYDGWTGSRTVRADRLDHILPVAPRVIKMDIEGAELTALRGCVKWLRDVPYVVSELSPVNLGYHNTRLADVVDYMAQFDKSLWRFDKRGTMPVRSCAVEMQEGPTNQMGLFATEANVQALWKHVDVPA